MDITYSQQSIVHLVRHLATLSTEAKNRILAFDDVHVSEKIIGDLLHTLGSKFNKKIDDPFVLAEFCIDIAKRYTGDNELNWKNGEDKLYTEFAYLVSTEDKANIGLLPSEYLGTGSVIKIPKDQISNVQTELRGKGEDSDKLKVNVLYGVPHQETDNLVISLGKIDNSITLLSAYTGILAPPFPGKFKQSEEEEKKSRKFWDTHAFLK